MRLSRFQGLAASVVVALTALPVCANRLTFEVWPDASPDHVMSCTFAISDGWISLVQVTGAGLPGPKPMRWRASSAEVDAVSSGLQALVAGDLGSVDPYRSRQPPAPFLSVTWMTRLDDQLASGLYIQPGLDLPAPLSQTLASLGVDRPCGFSATAGE
jgi:hypothetical protein